MFKNKFKFAAIVGVVTVIVACANTVFTVTNASEDKVLSYPVSVIPGGELVGMKVYTKGVYIVDISFVNTENGRIYPGKDSGLKKGDYITKINGYPINSIEEFSTMITGGEEYELEVLRKDKTLNTTITPVYSKEHNEYKVGLWIRDSTAGIGTVTFYNKETGDFAALGHAISDKDINKPLILREGKVYKASVSGVVKGEKGNPGELEGGFSPLDKETGILTGNNSAGVSGKCYSVPQKEEVQLGTQSDVTEGDAYIYSCVEGEEVKKYSVKIVKLLKSNLYTSKGMIVQVTDERLLTKTGGIVQGMSGSPVIQNGKLVGAVTHVFVNDPTRGYGIFIENMLAEAEKIK